MRNRFFVIIITSLILAAVGINLVHIYFFKSQRLKLIDRQIERSAAILLNSDEFNSSVRKLNLIEDVITKVLQGERIGKVFVLRSADNKIVYQSFNVSLLNTDLPTNSDWLTVVTEDQYVRIKNVKLHGKEKLILQVGLVLNQNFLNWEIVDFRVIVYVSGIVLALFLIAVLTTLILLSPLRLLSSHLRQATSNLTNMKDVQALPDNLINYSNDYWAKADEFSGLLGTVQKLINRINLNYKLTRSWTSQMAHELKTPLAIIKLETQAKKKENFFDVEYTQTVLGEVQHMSDIVTQFLDWAELENSQGQKDLHAVKIRSVVKNVLLRVEKMYSSRVDLKLHTDFSIVANPIHLDQLVSNLLINAIKYSPESQKVELTTFQNCLSVKDYGLGFPKEVLERFGQPFNVGANENKKATTGNGLGLAWVSTIVKTYQWDLKITSTAQGTTIKICFPAEDTETAF